MKRILRRLITLLVSATLATVLVAWVCAVIVDVAPAKMRTAAFLTGDDFWTVSRWERPGVLVAVSSVSRDWGWSPWQATGAPDTQISGDRQSAWASLTADGQREWLCLEYANSVIPKSVRVYENYCPGVIDRVTVFAPDGREIDAWRGKDPSSINEPSGTSEIPLSVSFPISKVKLHLNSPAVAGWNEIDAVGLVDQNGAIQWARRATASSSYGQPASTTPTIAGVESLMPAWADTRRFGIAQSKEVQGSVSRCIDGRGWPLIAMWCERDAVSGNATSGALGSTNNTATPAAATGGTILTALPVLRPALPYRIAWQGFAADVAFYVLIIAALAWIFTRPLKLVVEVSRMRHGCCIACGYDLGFDFVLGCPECGWRRSTANK